MKKTLFLVGLWLLWAQIGSSQSPSTMLPAQYHLQRVNAGWLKHAQLAPAEEVSFDTDAERIQLHLNLVVSHLRSKNKALTSEQLYQRERLLDTLQHYAQKGIFPINLYHEGRRPYFIDHRNTHCAVGYLIKASGYEDLAQKISQEHNYDYIADIRTQGLTEWAQQHGFELNELAWIQPGYPTSKSSISIKGGVNGEVSCLMTHEMSYGKGIVITGRFDTAGTIPCKGVGFYSAETGTWHCLGEGVEGRTEQIGFFDGRLALYGNFNYQGKNYPVAVYRQKTGWEYPERKFDTKHIATAGNGAFVCYYFPEEDRSELWAEGEDSNMVNVLDIRGRVNAITNYERTYYQVNVYPTALFGGAFDAIKRPHDSLWTPSYNLFHISNFKYPYLIHPQEEHVMDSIFSMKALGRTVYLGGHCSDSMYDHRQNCLVKLLDTLFIPALQFKHVNTFQFPDQEIAQIRDIVLIGNENPKIILAGKIRAFVGMHYSQGLIEYYPSSEKVVPFCHVDGTVNAATNYPVGHVAFGGRFSISSKHNRPPDVLNNLGRTYRDVTDVSIEDQQTSVLALYPNPASNELSIQLKNQDQIERVQIKSVNGQVLQETNGQGSSSLQVQLSNLSSGLYLAEVTTQQGQVWVQKLVVR